MPRDAHELAFARLWKLAREVRRSRPRAAFEPIGLTLDPEFGPGGFRGTTPVNSVTFAWIPGSSAHFGFLVDDRLLRTGTCPVVMSSPSADDNMVLGESLVEFLRLGCRTGFYDLEELVMPDRSLIARCPDDTHVADLTRTGRARLEQLCRRFRLRPWQDVERRLADLKAAYAKFVEIEPRDDDYAALQHELLQGRSIEEALAELLVEYRREQRQEQQRKKS